MLNGKVALVTGSSRGIGKSIALEFAASGASIAVVYLGDDNEAVDTVNEIQKLGVKVKSYYCDVSSFEDTKNTVSQILDDFGNVDILVNNAGITRDGLMLNMSEKNFDDVININLKGAFNMTRHLYAHMMKRRSGRIINISSISGMMGNAGQVNYSSSKAGLIGLTKSVAKELASRNITCNAIAPGFIETDMTAKMPEKTLAAAVASVPMKKMGTTEDIAKTALFLASEGAGYITGEVIKIDGGLYM